jgi:hypothetical protein
MSQLFRVERTDAVLGNVSNRKTKERRRQYTRLSEIIKITYLIEKLSFVIFESEYMGVKFHCVDYCDDLLFLPHFRIIAAYTCLQKGISSSMYFLEVQ